MLTFIAIVVVSLIGAATYFDWKWTKHYENERKVLTASLQPDTLWVVRTEADNPWVDKDFLALVLDVKNGYVKYQRGDHEESKVVKKVNDFLGIYIKKD